ncbi:hypothetical protein L218DRAFT_947177 [Marasmius fiardii PR-910]|nr:hypothetical protein L218DRAFT_947177 [Marasmius fiardii PR-910]
MTGLKSLLVLTAFTTAAFTVPTLENRQDGPKGPVDCVWVFKLILQTIMQDTNPPDEPGNISVWNYGMNVTLNPDDSLSVTGKIASYILEADELKSLMYTWPGQTFVGVGDLLWDVKSVVCQ